MKRVKAVAAMWINDMEGNMPVLAFVQTYGEGGDYSDKAPARDEIRARMSGLPKPVIVDCIITFDVPAKKGKKKVKK